MKYLKKLVSFWPIFLFLLLEIILFKTNFVPNTWLIGWDSTQPELNFKANLTREINAIWQEYRGLGLLDGMAHAANLVHLGFVYVLSLFLKPNLIRYVFIHLTHLIGGIGAFYLIKELLRKRNATAPALIGSLFYLLNPATIQMFFTPFEAFAIHFALLPWLLFSLVKYLKDSSKKNLFWLFLINLLAVSQAHIPTIFIVYALSLFIILLIYFVRKPKLWKKILIVFSLIFAVNAFWGLPYIYSAYKNAPVINNSKINRLSNSEVVLMNKAFGDAKNVSLFRGFSLDYGDWDESDNFGFQLTPWRDHLYRQEVEIITHVFLSLALVGILASLIKKDKNYYPFIILFFFSFLSLATNAKGFSFFRDLLVKYIPLYEEVFRFAFTKFSTLYALIASVLIGKGIKIFGNKTGYLIALIAIPTLLFLGQPAFKGNFLYSQLKADVPQEYFRTFSFFDVSKGRVALLPQPSFWGWEYLSWGYRGSGFIWQGIDNPVLHRSFDPWSGLSETYYQELSRAISMNDLSGLESVFSKYQVRWIVLDAHIYQPGSSKDETKILKTFIEKSEKISKVKEDGGITIYSFNLGSLESTLWSPEEYLRADVNLTYSAIDPFSTNRVSYVEDKEGITYPFLNLDPRQAPEVVFEEDDINILSKPLVFSGIKDLVDPNGNEEGFLTIDEEKRVKFVSPKESTEIASDEEIRNCNILKLGSVSKIVEGDLITYRAENGGVACDFISLPNLSHGEGYILRIKGVNREGRSLKIYLQNWETNRMDLEELLPTGSFDQYFFILPQNKEGEGYSLNLETRSFGKVASENTIEKIEISPFPHDRLTNIALVPEGNVLTKNNLEVIKVEKKGTAYYKVETKNEGLLVLGQGYEDGWIAFGNKERLEHIKVNSWANGWYVPEGVNSITIIFWPQYLEYLGFIVLVIFASFLVKNSFKRD